MISTSTIQIYTSMENTYEDALALANTYLEKVLGKEFVIESVHITISAGCACQYDFAAKKVLEVSRNHHRYCLQRNDVNLPCNCHEYKVDV